MKTFFTRPWVILICLFLSSCSSVTSPGRGGPPEKAGEAAVSVQAVSGAHTFEQIEYTNEDIKVVLSELCRKAGIRPVFAENIKGGSCTVRMKNVTHANAIRVVAESKRIKILKSEDVWFFYDDLSMESAEGLKSKAMDASSDPGFEAVLSGLITNSANVFFDYLAEESTAEKLARFEGNYFRALLKEGFTREEAFRLLESLELPELAEGGEKKGSDFQ